ncbi:amidase [Nitriliruptor alkaliphilus]|uniref:amidase n=1 Tax=Nitriliruptor alkaliphilus TaxID=427918 RepID=UPI000696FE95|nr:amidase family protein [Nitriliruptor alkaliphilus]
MTELIGLPALELASLVRERQVTSREIVEAFLARTEAVDPEVNAVTLVLADEALAAADAADRTEPTGPLHGVPISVKENIDLTGTPTTHGLPALADAMPEEDAPIVTRMRAAGAIPFLRTNLPEFGLRLDTDNPLRGRTRNPWDPSRTPGGSSGGEAAAIAARMSPLGLGNDIGGSLRNPAFCCGIVGFRPTTGRVPMASSLPPVDGPLSEQLMATDGPMGRRVDDVSAAMAILNGADPSDPRSVDVPLDRPSPAHRVAGVVTTGSDGPLQPAVAAAVGRAAEALAEAGWELEEVTLPELALVNEVWMRIMSEDIPGLVEAMGSLLTPRLREVLLDHVTYYDPDRIPRGALLPERRRLMRRWTEMFQRTPVVIGPVWPEQAFVGGADMEHGIGFVARFLQFVTPAPLLGLPALAVPTGTSDGVPVGVQIHADRWNDAWCFEAGRAIEAAVGVVEPPA